MVVTETTVVSMYKNEVVKSYKFFTSQYIYNFGKLQCNEIYNLWNVVFLSYIISALYTFDVRDLMKFLQRFC